MIVKEWDNWKERYMRMRRKLLEEEMRLVFKRDKLNKELRAVRSTMSGWDRTLINEGKSDEIQKDAMSDVPEEDKTRIEELQKQDVEVS